MNTLITMVEKDFNKFIKKTPVKTAGVFLGSHVGIAIGKKLFNQESTFFSQLFDLETAKYASVVAGSYYLYKASKPARKKATNYIKDKIEYLDYKMFG